MPKSLDIRVTYSKCVQGAPVSSIAPYKFYLYMTLMLEYSVNVTGETLVLEYYFTCFVLGKSLLFAE